MVEVPKRVGGLLEVEVQQKGSAVLAWREAECCAGRSVSSGSFRLGHGCLLPLTWFPDTPDQAVVPG